jgi:hypothetical protein
MKQVQPYRTLSTLLRSARFQRTSVSVKRQLPDWTAEEERSASSVSAEQ